MVERLSEFGQCPCLKGTAMHHSPGEMVWDWWGATYCRKHSFSASFPFFIYACHDLTMARLNVVARQYVLAIGVY